MQRYDGMANAVQAQAGLASLCVSFFRVENCTDSVAVRIVLMHVATSWVVVALYLVRVQEFCEWADPVRQCAIKKPRFRALLWDKLCARIQSCPELQTDEVPEGTESGKRKKSTGEEWKAPDELSSFIRQMHPEWDEVKIFIEKWIEETIVPKFANGDWPLQMGSCNDSPEWNTHGQERQCVMHVAWRCDAVCCVRARHSKGGWSIVTPS